MSEDAVEEQMNMGVAVAGLVLFAAGPIAALALPWVLRHWTWAIVATVYFAIDVSWEAYRDAQKESKAKVYAVVASIVISSWCHAIGEIAVSGLLGWWRNEATAMGVVYYTFGIVASRAILYYWKRWHSKSDDPESPQVSSENTVGKLMAPGVTALPTE